MVKLRVLGIVNDYDFATCAIFFYHTMDIVQFGKREGFEELGDESMIASCVPTNSTTPLGAIFRSMLVVSIRVRHQDMVAPASSSADFLASLRVVTVMAQCISLRMLMGVRPTEEVPARTMIVCLG